MSWAIEYSKDADKFQDKNLQLKPEIYNEIKKLVLNFAGSPINIDFKKLHGKWEGYHRIRKGQLRIIVEIFKHEQIIFVKRIDFRGNIY